MSERPRRRKSRAKAALPKGAYRLPTGNYVSTSVGPPDKRGRRIRVTGIHRAEPDAKLIAQVLIDQVTRTRQDVDPKTGRPR